MTKAISTEQSLLGLTTPCVAAGAASVRGRGLSGLRSRRKHRKEHIEAHMKRKASWREKLDKRRRDRREKTDDADPARFIPDLHSRYFTADFPYGLNIIHQIGKLAGVSMPRIEELLAWYDNIAVINDKLNLSDYGISNMEELREFYLQK